MTTTTTTAPKNSMRVISSARKLLFKVPAAGAVSIESLAAEKGVSLNTYSQALSGPGIVVLNSTDGTWQGAGVDGYIIVNNVKPNIAEQALERFEDGLSCESLNRALGFLREAGFGDQYSSSKEFVEKHLSTAGERLACGSGHVKRDARDVSTVWLKGGVIRLLNPQGELRDIREYILIETHLREDGGKINPAEIPVVDVE